MPSSSKTAEKLVKLKVLTTRREPSQDKAWPEASYGAELICCAPLQVSKVQSLITHSTGCAHRQGGFRDKPRQYLPCSKQRGGMTLGYSGTFG